MIVARFVRLSCDFEKIARIHVEGGLSGRVGGAGTTRAELRVSERV